MHDVWIPDYSAYPVAVTVECAPGGMADCDGWSEDMDACECPCHGNGIHPDKPVPETVGEVIAWHEEMHAEAEKARVEHERVR